MASNGTVSVTVVQGGKPYPLSMSVTVNPRTGFAFTAVSPQKVANGSQPELTVANPPPSSGAAIGRNLLNFVESYNYRQIGGGPNDLFKYITSISDLSYYRWVISPAVETPTSEFYFHQCGNYDPQADTGFVSGDALMTNSIHHESANSANSHYFNYRVAQNDPQKNIGTGAESFLRGPSTDLTTFVNEWKDFLKNKETVIRTAKDVEPCGGFVNRNHSGSCEKIGAINFPIPSYQSCP